MFRTSIRPDGCSSLVWGMGDSLSRRQVNVHATGRGKEEIGGGGGEWVSQGCWSRSKRIQYSKESGVFLCVHWQRRAKWELNKSFSLSSSFPLSPSLFLSLSFFDTAGPAEASAGSRDNNVEDHLKRAETELTHFLTCPYSLCVCECVDSRMWQIMT